MDVLTTFAKLAADRGYARPDFTSSGELLIIGGRHPVIERTPASARGAASSPTTSNFEPHTQTTFVITGPTWAASPYLRQAALIALMAQAGSFVPAHQAKMPIVDRIFTRIRRQQTTWPARSNLSRRDERSRLHPQSRHTRKPRAPRRSRPRHATFDGLSIAWAVVEHLQKHTRARTLFATHYHELTELAELLQP